MIYVNVIPPTKMLETGIKSNISDIGELTLYPNPNEGLFELSYVNYNIAPAKISVFDIVGKKIADLTMDDANGRQKKELDLRTAPAGVYFLRVESGNASTTMKFIITK
jgi:hypothetical protein